MAKPFLISFRVKSAEEVAQQLGVSKARRNRIFKIVGETLKKNSPEETLNNGKSKIRPVGENTYLTLRLRQRNNAKAAR